MKRIIYVLTLAFLTAFVFTGCASGNADTAWNDDVEENVYENLQPLTFDEEDVDDEYEDATDEDGTIDEVSSNEPDEFDDEPEEADDDENEPISEDTSDNAIIEEIIEESLEEISMEFTVRNESNPLATITMESGDIIVIELFPDIAPNTVNNFISLANSGFYDGVIFHRVIPNFMIQGGCPDGTGMGGPGYSIFGEFGANGFENNLSHTRGVVSMARTPAPNSGGSQFFICVGDPTFLDNDYAGFGMVVHGMEVADAIVAQPRDRNDRPNEPQRIATIAIDTRGVTFPAPERM